ncbi:MAG: M20/M25/M40 family metallo-hydrolase, partial [Treponema sp.]|nr:M20/M25/M40 family metallo-hydrolase [Treponema sp.]
FNKNDFALIPDAGDDKGCSIEIAEKNMLWLRFVTKGKQTHGSRPDMGANAFLAGSDLAVQLHEKLSEKFSTRNPLFEPDFSTFEPTKKEANVPNINTIPGEDVFCYDMRILPCYPIDDVLKEIEKIKAEVEKKHGVSTSFEIKQRNESPATSPNSPLIKLLSANVEEVYGTKTKCIGIGGGTFAAFLRNAEIDSAVWARLNGSAHEPNEYALLENILGDARVMALMMVS